jgi:hypothetical protein
MQKPEDMPLEGIGQWVESKFLYSRKGGSTRGKMPGRKQRGQAIAVSNLGNVETTCKMKKGVSWVTLTNDSPSAHSARQVAGVKAAAWW